MTRGPIVPKLASCAAGGTTGGFSRIDHVMRLRPRRFDAGSVSITLPFGSSTSIFRSPNRWRVRW